MWGNMIYLDNSSTTKQSKEVTEVMIRSFEKDFGNPSSLHELGRTVQNRINDVRGEIAKSIGFSDNLALFGAADARKRDGKQIITTKIEHPAVLEPCRKLEKMGFEVVYIDVDKRGIPILKQYEEALNRKTILVSVMAVNNEIGTVLPIEKMAEMAHVQGALFHTDAVQGLGKINLRGCGADFISISAHKIHGPKGVGAIAVRKGSKINAMMLGGGQEH